MSKSKIRFLLHRICEVVFFIPPITLYIIVHSSDYMYVKKCMVFAFLIYGCLCILSIIESVYLYRKNETGLKQSIYRLCICFLVLIGTLFRYFTIMDLLHILQ